MTARDETIQSGSVLDRRTFLCVAAALPAVTMLGGCAAAMVAHRVTPVDGVIRLPIANYKELSAPNGVLRVLPEGAARPFYVVAGEKGYIVVSSVCTHAGCTVDPDKDRFVCPCHGSVFDREGRVLEGPASAPLPRYDARVENNTLIIQLGRTS
jgi:Rieske Fe-S protein